MSRGSSGYLEWDAQAARTRRLRRAALAVTTLAGLWLAGCGTQRPVVYEGGEYARQDIDECMRLAQNSGVASGKGGAVARDTAVGAAVGGAATGVYSAVRGYSDVGNRTAAGAAAGAAVGLIRGGLRANEPSGTYKGYVNRCLRDRGYDVVGWD